MAQLASAVASSRRSLSSAEVDALEGGRLTVPNADARSPVDIGSSPASGAASGSVSESKPRAVPATPVRALAAAELKTGAGRSPPPPAPPSGAFTGLHALSAIAMRASPTPGSVESPWSNGGRSQGSPLHVLATGEATTSPSSFRFIPPPRDQRRPSPSPSPSAHLGLSILEATAVLALDRSASPSGQKKSRRRRATVSPARRTSQPRRVSATPPKAAESGGGSGDGEKEETACTHCRVLETSQWRRNKFGPSPICNACYAHTLTHDELPPLDETGNRIYASGRKPRSSAKRRRSMSTDREVGAAPEPRAGSAPPGGRGRAQSRSSESPAPSPSVKRRKVGPSMAPLVVPGPSSAGILDGYTCMVTGLDEGSDDRKAEIVALIKEHAGVVVSTFPADVINAPPSADADPAAKARLGLVVISDRPRRTHKYLVALAVGTPTVHYQWVLDSVEARVLVPPGSYIIASGYSLVTRTESAANVLAVGARVFRGLVPWLLGSPKFVAFWKYILRAGGASLPPKDKLERINVAVAALAPGSAAAAVDKPSPPPPTRTRRSLRRGGAGGAEKKGGGKRASAKRTVKKIEDTEAVVAVADALSGLSFVLTDIHPADGIVAGASAAKVPLVSFEYVIQCIINQRVLKADSHAKFRSNYVPANVHGPSAISSAKPQP